MIKKLLFGVVSFIRCAEILNVLQFPLGLRRFRKSEIKLPHAARGIVRAPHLYYNLLRGGGSQFWEQRIYAAI